MLTLFLRAMSRTALRDAGLVAGAALIIAGGRAHVFAQQKAEGSSATAARPTTIGDQATDVLQIRQNFYMIAGAGANIAVQIGPDGVVVVDAGSVDRADLVVAEIKKLTRHMTEDMVWRNGVQASDQATITETFVRHDNTLTITMILEDPIYPEYRKKLKDVYAPAAMCTKNCCGGVGGGVADRDQNCVKNDQR